MTAYGILLVDTRWANNDNAQIDTATYMRHKDQLIAGTRALIYVRAPIDAVVAAAEVTGDILETETLPPDPGFSPSILANLHPGSVIEQIEAESDPPAAVTGIQKYAKTYRVPLKIVRIKGQVAPISLERVHAILDSKFSVYDETWIPLSENDYNTIVALWEKV